MQCRCTQCGGTFDRPTGAVNRAKAVGAPLYCGRFCAGWARQTVKPPEAERKAAKAEYDRKRREQQGERLLAEKRAHYHATKDERKEQHAAYRKTRMPYHVAYCSTPEYKAKKAAYDKRKRYEAYGPFADAAKLLDELEKEIRARATRYEIYVANGRYTRSAQQRRRELWQLMQRT